MSSTSDAGVRVEMISLIFLIEWRRLAKDAGGYSHMRSRINGLVVAVSVLVTAIGCEEPKDVIPVAPPGFDLVRIPSTPQGEGAQALGETASAISAAKKSQPVAPQVVANAPHAGRTADQGRQRPDLRDPPGRHRTRLQIGRYG